MILVGTLLQTDYSTGEEAGREVVEGRTKFASDRRIQVRGGEVLISTWLDKGQR